MEYGVVRKLDKLGRLVIPNDLRKLYDMHPETPVVLIPTEERILLKAEEKRG